MPQKEKQKPYEAPGIYVFSVKSLKLHNISFPFLFTIK